MKQPSSSSFRQQRSKRTGQEAPSLAADVLHTVLAGLGGDETRARLTALWQCWPIVMGPELAPLAMPLGQHKGILLIGAEDTMILQELQLQGSELLERANAFMGEDFFCSVRLSLVLGKTRLDLAPPAPPAPIRLPLPPPPSGMLLAQMDASSPVARCYARFAGKPLPTDNKS